MYNDATFKNKNKVYKNSVFNCFFHKLVGCLLQCTVWLNNPVLFEDLDMAENHATYLLLQY